MENPQVETAQRAQQTKIAKVPCTLAFGHPIHNRRCHTQPPRHCLAAWPVEDSVAMRRQHRNSNGVGSRLIYLYCWWPSHMSMTRVNTCTLVTRADPSKCWTPLISLCLSSKDYRKPCQSCRLTNVKATVSESKSYQRQSYQRQWFQQLHGNYQHIPTWQLGASYTGVKPRGATITLCHADRK